MKYFILTTFLGLFLTNLSFGQSQDFNKAIKSSVKTLAKSYKLKASQKDMVTEIQTQYFQNLEEITPIRNTNPKLYLKKRIAIRNVTDQAIRRLLSPEQQIKMDQQIDKRKTELNALLYKEKPSESQSASLLLEAADLFE